MVNAQAAGLDVGVYWYSYARTVEGALLEAKACYEIIKAHNYTYPIYYDIEEPYIQSNLSTATVSAMIQTFCNYLEDRGYFAGVYSYSSLLSTRVYDSVLERYAVWVASYSSTKPVLSRKYGMWQYSSTGHVDGISTQVDMNYGYINYPAIVSPETYKGPLVYPDNPTVTIPPVTTTTTMPMGVYIDQTYGTEVNWAAVKADGASYAVVSAGSGSEGADENFAANVNGAHSAGLGAAAIWHATSSTVDGIKAEAATFESVISGFKFEYPICLDLTDSAITGAGLTATQYEELVSAFCSYFEGKKYFISIRCDLSFINSSLNTSLFDKYDVWVRSYSNTKPNIGKTYGIWNYSSSAVNGVTGNVDKFYSYKNYPNIMSYNHLNGF